MIWCKNTFAAFVGLLTGPAIAAVGTVVATKALNMYNTIELIQKQRDVYLQDLYDAIFFSEFLNPTLSASSSAIKGTVAPGANPENVLASIIVDLIVQISIEVTGSIRQKLPKI